MRVNDLIVTVSNAEEPSIGKSGFNVAQR